MPARGTQREPAHCQVQQVQAPTSLIQSPPAALAVLLPQQSLPGYLPRASYCFSFPNFLAVSVLPSHRGSLSNLLSALNCLNNSEMWRSQQRACLTLLGDLSQHLCSYLHQGNPAAHAACVLHPRHVLPCRFAWRCTVRPKGTWLFAKHSESE